MSISNLNKNKSTNIPLLVVIAFLWVLASPVFAEDDSSVVEDVVEGTTKVVGGVVKGVVGAAGPRAPGVSVARTSSFSD